MCLYGFVIWKLKSVLALAFQMLPPLSSQDARIPSSNLSDSYRELTVQYHNCVIDLHVQCVIGNGTLNILLPV